MARTRVRLTVAVLAASLFPADAQVRFEVASVKLAPAGGMAAISPPGAAKFSAMNVSLDVLIGMAYGIDSRRISGRPGGLSYEQIRPMEGI